MNLKVIIEFLVQLELIKKIKIIKGPTTQPNSWSNANIVVWKMREERRV